MNRRYFLTAVTLPLLPSLTPTAFARRSGAFQTGTVKWFSEAKGFGFITVDGSGADIFVQNTDIVGERKVLATNQRVGFEILQGPKGPQAKQVRPA